MSLDIEELNIEELKRLAREAMNAKWQPLRYMEYLDIQRKYELAASPSVVDELIQRLERAEQALNPRMWSEEQNHAWNRAIPDLYLAFEAIRNVK